MKKALSTLLAYITCTDPAVKTKWANVLASFWHKDEGKIITGTSKAENGDVTLGLVDGYGVTETLVIEKTQLPTSYEISFINGLEEALSSKVDKVGGVPILISSDTTAQKFRLYVLTASLTLKMPAGPTLGDSVKVANLSEQNDCVIAANGSKIMGVEEDMTLDDGTASFELIYTGTAKGWVIIGAN